MHDLITSLNQVPALTRSWLAPLETENPELYEELARDIVIDLATREPQLDTVLPAGYEDIRHVLRTLDLAGKQIGEFYFALSPNAGRTAEEQLTAYNEKYSRSVLIKDDFVLLGSLGENWVIATTGALALIQWESLTSENQYTPLLPLARRFDAFILAQANAYNAFKRCRGKSRDVEGYRIAQNVCAAHPIFRDTNVPLIFECQLTA